MIDMHLGIGMTIDNANARGLGRAFYNGNPVLGGAILPAGTTGNHNGQPVIGVRNINGVTPGADNSIVLVLSTDRIPKQQWVFTSHSLTDRVNGNAGSIGNRSTSYVGYFLPGATSPTGLLSNNWILNYYRPTAIVASFSKS